MIALSPSQEIIKSRIRKLDLSRDLDQVADLIERCFPIHLDYDGQTYIREMRKAAQEMRFMGWLSSFADLTSNKAPGFIWEEEGRILGNLSMIPFKNQGRKIILIANVAVDPEYRRLGIARALTNHALIVLRSMNVAQVWLQVRDDNPAACQLYRSTGFVDRAVRTTWRILPNEIKSFEQNNEQRISVRHRKKEDWEDQNRWLSTAYPLTIRWNLSVDFNRFEPGVLQSVSNFLDGFHFKHWGVDHKGEFFGSITWQKTNNYANNLWLAFPEDRESMILANALHKVMKRLPGRHPISIDYPKGRFEVQFQALGFEHFRSLIWMKQNL
jgi:ribosomal protein S18 acetylase RimI-like enzyme